MTDYRPGGRLPIEDSAWLDRTGIFANPDLRIFAAPFPPASLMHNVSGLQRKQDSPQAWTDCYTALARAADRPSTQIDAVLDFGCGCGRLAGMFKGDPYGIHGCDVDPRHSALAGDNLTYMKEALTFVRSHLTYDDDAFDAIVSISVFTHLNQSSQLEYLTELHSISRPGGQLFLTVHGTRALERDMREKSIRNVICVGEEPFPKARQAFLNGEDVSILQHGNLSNLPRRFSWTRLLFGRRIVKEPFEYGITFIPEVYLRAHWAKFFKITGYLPCTIHLFQDIVVLTTRRWPCEDAAWALAT